MQNCKIARINKKAFTLSEVLITLMVIGVVAALAIPALLTTTNDAEYKIAWKKYYSEISRAYNMMKLEEGGTLDHYFGIVGGNNDLETAFIKQFKVIGELNPSNYNIPVAEIISYQVSYITLAGNLLAYNNITNANAMLITGAQMYMRTYTSDYALVWIDVDGYKKGPNVLGKDMFGAVFTKDWVKPMGATGTGAQDTCNTTEKTASGTASFGYHSPSYISGAGCSAEYLLE